MTMAETDETIILVHGAMHGAWCWERIVPLLEARGRKVVSIDLPGLGDDRTPADSVTFQDYVDRVVDTAGATSGRVVLVGHSMGGFPITQAGEVLGDRVSRLVYVAAAMPIPGDPASEISGRIFASSESLLAQAARGDAAPGYLEVDPAMATPLFYHTCPAEDAAKAIARLRPQPQKPTSEGVTTTHEVWGAIPKTYVLCLQDKAVPPAIQRWMCDRVPAITVHELDVDHSPFYSAPEELADILAI